VLHWFALSVNKLPLWGPANAGTAAAVAHNTAEAQRICIFLQSRRKETTNIQTSTGKVIEKMSTPDSGWEFIRGYVIKRSSASSSTEPLTHWCMRDYLGPPSVLKLGLCMLVVVYVYIRGDIFILISHCPCFWKIFCLKTTGRVNHFPNWDTATVSEKNWNNKKRTFYCRD